MSVSPRVEEEDNGVSYSPDNSSVEADYGSGSQRRDGVTVTERKRKDGKSLCDLTPL